MKNTNDEFLKKFVEEDKLNQLDRLASKVNYFEVLSISNTEIRHSNMLAWLIQPNANHNLSDSIITQLLQYISEKSTLNSYSEVVEKLISDSDEVKVFREWNYIDILIISHKYNLLIAIENKIYANEHGNQLETYRKCLEEKYPEYKKIYIYLTLFGEEASGDKEWESVSYLDIIKMIEKTIESSNDIEKDVEILLQHYLEILRRLTMTDDKIKKLANEIYNEHQKAIDLIVQNIEKPGIRVMGWCEDFGKGNWIVFQKETSKDTRVRFLTKKLYNIFPKRETGKENDWGGFYDVMYEIVCAPYPTSIRLTCNKKYKNSTVKRAVRIFEDRLEKGSDNRYSILKVYKLSDRQIQSQQEFLKYEQIVKDEIFQIISNQLELFENELARELNQQKNLTMESE